MGTGALWRRHIDQLRERITSTVHPSSAEEIALFPYDVGEPSSASEPAQSELDRGPESNADEHDGAPSTRGAK